MDEDYGDRQEERQQEGQKRPNRGFRVSKNKCIVNNIYSVPNMRYKLQIRMVKFKKYVFRTGPTLYYFCEKLPKLF